MVGLLPLCATTVIEAWQRERTPFATAAVWARANQMAESNTGMWTNELPARKVGMPSLVNSRRARCMPTE